jgi:hypothetical protein
MMIPLAGAWWLRFSPGDVGVAQENYAHKFEETVRLPGTTDENHKGIRRDKQCVDRLSATRAVDANCGK